MKNIKGFNRFINENVKTPTVEEVIKLYTDPKMGQGRWSMARRDFYDMARGGDGDVYGEEGELTLRNDEYKGWENEDFKKVIITVEGPKAELDKMDDSKEY